MKEYERFVIGLHKASNRKPRLSKREQIILPTKDCPLPDHTSDLTDDEWVMLCHIVHSPLNQ